MAIRGQSLWPVSDRARGPLLRGRADNHRRVVRGGCFNNNRRNARCAYRNRNDPDNLNRNQGFRPVVAHAFPIRRNCPAGAITVAFPFRAEA